MLEVQFLTLMPLFCLLCLLLNVKLVCASASLAGQETTGNLINVAYKKAQKGERVLIVQGCNCFAFGGGLSAQIGRHLPEAERADQATTRGDSGKLGDYSSADVVRNGVTLKIINAYTQYRGGEETQLNLERNIKSVFKKIASDFPGYKIYYPAIGCGIAGGDWEKIHPIIKEALKGRNYTFVRFKPGEKVQLPRAITATAFVDNKHKPGVEEAMNAKNGSVCDGLMPAVWLRLASKALLGQGG